MCALSRRAYSEQSASCSWEEIWEAGPFYDRISDCLELAENFAIFVGWQIDSRLPMKRPAFDDLNPLGRETLQKKLIRLCESRPQLQVFLLMWDHAYFYALERETWQGRVWESIHPRIHFVFDNRHPFGGSHHEKICLIDGRIAFCGGIDLCDDRWDSPQHLFHDPRRSLDWKTEQHGPYHDLAVQVTGPICEKIQAHIAERWKALCRTPFPGSPRRRFSQKQVARYGHTVYLSRTSIPIAASPENPRAIREIEFLFRDLIQSAKKRIILEGQYYWSPQINDLLISHIHKMKNQDFEIILILTDLEKTDTPTKKMAYYQYHLLQKLNQAAHASGIRLICGNPYVFSRPVYIHSKLILVDDQYLSIGSANFATRALRLDTELNLTLEARTPSERLHISRVAHFILSHWSQSTINIRFIKKPSSKPFIPWEIFFDPNAPWIYLWKRKHIQAFLQNPQLLIALIFPLWIITSMLIVRMSNLPLGLHHLGAGFYCLILSSVWVARFPYFLTLILLTFMEGSTVGSRVLFYSLWIASAWSYTIARLFPSTADRYFRVKDVRYLPKLERGRSFSSLISILIDPRISIHSKISYPGLYFMPLPWFILGTGLILPALIYPWIRLSELLSGWLGNKPELLQPFAQFFLPLILLCWIGGDLLLSWQRLSPKRHGDGAAKDQSQHSFLQYSQRIQPKQSQVQPEDNPTSDSTGAS